MKKGKTQSLGRGLGELLGEIEEAYDNEIPKNGDVLELSISTIKANPYQPRKSFDEKSLIELSHSIKEHGLLQPIVVKEDIDGYTLIAGERRLRASKLAKIKTIRAVVSDVDDTKMRHHALKENIQRDELNAIDLANAYSELMKVYDATHDELSKIVYKSRAHISNTLRLLQLSKKTQKALVQGIITAGHAKVMIGLSENEQEIVVNSIVGQKLNVRAVEQLVKQLKNRQSSEKVEDKKSTPLNFNFRNVSSHLQDLGYKTTTKSNKITIEFSTENEIATFLKHLQK